MSDLKAEEEPKGRELIPAPWTLTERDLQILDKADFETFPRRFMTDLRRARNTHGIRAETEAFELALKWRRARADLKKALGDEREQDLRLAKLEGEEIEINKLQRECFRLTNELSRSAQETAKQARLKEIAIAHKGETDVRN